MRLKYIEIGDYKNLKNFKLNFEGESFLDVFVGKNGTGKSNLFEALIEIFKHLYEDDYEVSFSYKLHYSIESQQIKINWRWDKSRWLDESDNETRKIAKRLLPDNILIYYSGHNKKVTELLNAYEEKHKATIDNRRNNSDFLETVTRRFSFIDGKYKSILLTVLLLQDAENRATQYIKEKLDIVTIGKEIRLNFKRPDYALGNDELLFDEFDEDGRFWSPQGYFRELLNKIWTVEKEQNTPTRNEGKQDDDKYIMYRKFLSFQESFSSYSPLELFIAFDNLMTIGYLEDIQFDIKLKNGAKIGINQFSDGQFQAIYIYALTEIFKDKNSITLLDEPDSFLHPEWQYDFLKQVMNITEDISKSNHVLMSSHSASTILSHIRPYINLFSIKDESISVSKIGKGDAIKTLSKGMISLMNNETIMSINTYLKNTIQPVLFTEGITDEYILDIAWKKLYPDDVRPFSIHNAFDRIFLRNLFSREEIRTNHPGRVFFALFDFDEAYDDWNGLTKRGTDIVTDPFKGLVRKLNGLPHYGMLLPVPQNPLIKRQVIRPDNKPWGKGTECHLSIEHLFYCNDLAEDFYELESISGGGQIVKFTGNKVRFAEDIVPDLAKENFEIFRPMFDFIISKINVGVTV